MMKIIDPHIHLFDLKKGDYDWLKTANPPFWPDKTLINKNFNEQNLLLNTPLLLAGFIHIEAGFDNQQPWRELSYLQQECQLPYAAIASINLRLDNDRFNSQLEKLSHCVNFCGVRHILDEQAFDLLNTKQVLINFSLLNNFAEKRKQPLVFELQMPLDDHLSITALCDVISKHKNISFIINHAGFPTAKIDSIEWRNWQTNLTKLAIFENIAIKCSGWEMTDRQYTYQQDWLNHNLATCFTAFGEKRMMLASNFPLCLFTHTSYQDYWQSLLDTDFMRTKSMQEKSALCYRNALHYYHL